MRTAERSRIFRRLSIALFVCWMLLAYELWSALDLYPRLILTAVTLVFAAMAFARNFER